MSSLSIPRLPVLGWKSFTGRRRGSVPNLGDEQNFIYTTSGSAAIELGLKYLNIGPGDRVLVPTYHCPTMIAPIVALGAEPIFFPITSGGRPNLDYLRANGSSGARAMIAVHYFGFPRSITAVRKFCDSEHVVLIEDCAHAFFGMNDGQPIGTVGDLAVGSLTKFFPVSEGGCLVARNSDIKRIALQRRTLVAQVKALLDVIELGVRYRRLSMLHSAFAIFLAIKRLSRRSTSAISLTQEGEAQTVETQSPQVGNSESHLKVTAVNRWLCKYAFHERIIQNRRRNFAALTEALARVEGVQLVHKVLPEFAVPYVFPICVENADHVYRSLRSAGVPVFRWDVRWPGTPRLAGDAGEKWAHQIIQVACHQDLSLRDIAEIATSIRECSVSN